MPSDNERALSRYQDSYDRECDLADHLDKLAEEEARSAGQALSDPQAWDWHGPAHILHTTENVPYSADEVLQEAREYSPDVNRLYAELLASPAAQKLREAVAADWAHRMWETRTAWQIGNAARKKPLDDFDTGH